MIWNLLTSQTSSNSGGGGNSNYSSLIMLGIMVVAIVLLMVFSRRSNKKKQEETEAMLKAIKPGNKVKTIGGICGVVVEICPDDNTFVLETGTEASGKSFLKFDMQAVYQTDAVVEKQEDKKEEKTEEKVEATPVEEQTEETATEDKE